MKPLKILFALIALGAALASCNNGTTYAELLTDENKASNAFLANQRVVGYEERDSTFQFDFGPEAPYYQLDAEANLFMQVLNPGTPGNRAETDQQIYFRFTRYNLLNMVDGKLPTGDGNNTNLGNGSESFRFNNYSASSSASWGIGIQAPLIYLPIDCEVNILIKSQMGPSTEISNVVPYLYNVRYFKSQI